jgi:hypothetical protein
MANKARQYTDPFSRGSVLGVGANGAATGWSGLPARAAHA